MEYSREIALVEKLPTGIPGFDFISEGGLPKGRSSLVAGTAGSAKTVFSIQYLAEGIFKYQQPGVFVTFEERPEDIRTNMLSFGWNIQTWEEKGLWKFVDASPVLEDQSIVAGEYDLSALLNRINHAIRMISAERIVIDSIGAIFGQFTDHSIVRQEIFKLVASLRKEQVTSVITVERVDEYGEIARYGVEEFVADNVIVLRNALEEARRRRTIEILKFRGASHSKGEFPFSVLPGQGIVAIPLSAIEMKQHSFDRRLTSGNTILDEMCGGGFFQDSIVLLSGGTGTGKTLLTTQFIEGGAKAGEKALLFAFEESHSQLLRNAKGWGVDFKELERSGHLRIVSLYPEVAGLEDHLIMMKREIDTFQPTRIGIDSLSAMERVSTPKGFREFVIGLTSFIKERGIVAMVTSTTPTLLGGTSITEGHISTITDVIILLRYVEMYGEIHRGIAVLKMRGSNHDKRIREFQVTSQGMRIGDPFHHVVGVLSGNINLISDHINNSSETLMAQTKEDGKSGISKTSGGR